MGPLSVVAPRGLIVNANPPAPVCMSTNHCAEEIIEAVFKALAKAVPQAVNAGFSRRLRYAITGTDPRSGRYFIWHFFMARGGGGASLGIDGWTCVGEVNVAGPLGHQGICAGAKVTQEASKCLFAYLNPGPPDRSSETGNQISKERKN